jgi:hypothetical protein
MAPLKTASGGARVRDADDDCGICKKCVAVKEEQHISGTLGVQGIKTAAAAQLAVRCDVTCRRALLPAIHTARLPAFALRLPSGHCTVCGPVPYHTCCVQDHMERVLRVQIREGGFGHKAWERILIKLKQRPQASHTAAQIMHAVFPSPLVAALPAVCPFCVYMYSHGFCCRFRQASCQACLQQPSTNLVLDNITSLPIRVLFLCLPLPGLVCPERDSATHESHVPNLHG